MEIDEEEHVEEGEKKKHIGAKIRLRNRWRSLNLRLLSVWFTVTGKLQAK